MEKQIMDKILDLIVEDINVSIDDKRISISYVYVSRFRAKELDQNIDKIMEIINSTNEYETPDNDYQIKGQENHLDFSRFVWFHRRDNA